MELPMEIKLEEIHMEPETEITLQESYDSYDINLVNDIEKNSNDRLPCPFCNSDFTKRCSVKYHIERVHQKRKDFFCDICGQMFAQGSSLKKHKLKSCKVAKILQHGGKLNIGRQITPSDNGTFECELCQKFFVSEDGLSSHITIEHNDNEEFYVCPHCDKSFKRKKSLNIHLRKYHQGICTFPCKQCSEKFPDALSLSQHVSAFHGIVREFYCQICGTEFVALGAAKQHIREFHPGMENGIKRKETLEPAYNCTHCGKSFGNEGALVRHENFEHAKFACQMCPARYLTNEALQQHVAFLHEVTGYECTICAVACTTNKEILDHLVTFHAQKILEKYVIKKNLSDCKFVEGGNSQVEPSLSEAILVKSEMGLPSVPLPSVPLPPDQFY